MKKRSAICKFCKKEFIVKKDAAGLFCSHKCHREDQKIGAWETKDCEECGKEFTRRTYLHARFCSHACSLDWQRKNKHLRNSEYCKTEKFKNAISESQKGIWEKRRNGTLKNRDASTWHTDEWKQAQSQRIKKLFAEGKIKKRNKLSKEDEKTVIRMYNEFMSSPKIAKRFNVHSATIQRVLKRNGIKIRPMKKDFHPCWKGGRKHYYGANWKQAKEETRIRDNWTCQMCGSKENIRVHHIRKIQTFSFDELKQGNNLDNLVCLCTSCHNLVHSTRKN